MSNESAKKPNAPNDWILDLIFPATQANTDPLAQRQAGLQGEYPEGRINEDDCGAFGMAIGIKAEGGEVVVRFLRPVSWFALSPVGALQLAAFIAQLAERARDQAKPKS